MESSMVPENQDGIQTNTESSVEIKEQDVHLFFEAVKNRLRNVNQWQKLAGKASADFRLTDAKGREVNRSIQTGDHLRINIPGPGNITGEGYDWVKVEAIEETEDTLSIRVRPSSNPLNNQEDIAHFFDERATSSFMVKREGNTITAAIYGRNENPNTDVEKTVDKIRNTAISSGAIAGLSKLQWKALVNGFISALD